MKAMIRIGGSVVASPLNPALISKYVDLLKNLKRGGHEVVTVVGGGSLARDFIKIAGELGLSEPDQDEVAISVSRLIAQLFVKKLGNLSSGVVPTSVDDAVKWLKKGKIVIIGGLKPGMTTDAVAAMIAEKMKAELLVKATDQEGIYSKDPKKHPDAEKIDELSFNDLFRLFEEDKHKAGIHQILDPEAVRILQRSRTRTVVVNGFESRNVLLAVSGEKVGTVIE